MQRELKKLEEHRLRLHGQIEESKHRAEQYSTGEQQLKVKRQKLFNFMQELMGIFARNQEAQILILTDAINDEIRQEMKAIKKNPTWYR